MPPSHFVKGVNTTVHTACTAVSTHFSVCVIFSTNILGKNPSLILKIFYTQTDLQIRVCIENLFSHLKHMLWVLK